MADYFADRPERPFAALPALTSNESQVTLIPIEDPPGLSEEELSELDKAQAAQASAVEEEKAIDFNPQEYLMENLEHYAIQPTLSGEDRYRYIFPLVGGTPLEITNHFLSPPDMAPLINIHGFIQKSILQKLYTRCKVERVLKSQFLSLQHIHKKKRKEFYKISNNVVLVLELLVLIGN